jgi:uncharacterized membrane protein YhfC
MPIVCLRLQLRSLFALVLFDRLVVRQGMEGRIAYDGAIASTELLKQYVSSSSCWCIVCASGGRLARRLIGEAVRTGNVYIPIMCSTAIFCYAAKTIGVHGIFELPKCIS